MQSSKFQVPPRCIEAVASAQSSDFCTKQQITLRTKIESLYLIRQTIFLVTV